MAAELKQAIIQIITQEPELASIDACVDKVRQNPCFKRVPLQIISLKVREVLADFGYQQETAKKGKRVKEATKTDEFFTADSSLRFSDIGGFEKVKKTLQDFLEANVRNFLAFSSLGFAHSRRGILICGAEGSGKSTLASAFCSESGLRHLRLTKGNKKLKSILTQGSALERLREEPCIVHFEDIDSFLIDEKSEDQQALVQFLDETRSDRIYVVGTLTRTELLPSRFLGPGRFELKVDLALPSEEERKKIIDGILQKKSHNVTVEVIAAETAGYLCGDLYALALKAAELSVLRCNGKGPILGMTHFQEALSLIRPLSTHRGFSSIPKVTFDDVGALESQKSILSRLILQPLTDPQTCARYGIKRTAGILLWGPPGCGKTLLAKAVANAAKANFIYVKGPELFSKYVGESEKAVRGLFDRARLSAPCLIFFDEIDGLVPRRGSGENNVAERVVNQMLTEMNGLDDLEQVYLIGATNRPDIIDPAILRPERLGTHIYVPLPDLPEQVSILRALLRCKPLAQDVSIEDLLAFRSTKWFSGADLAMIVDNASRNAAWGADCSGLVCQAHFVSALREARPSIGDREIENIERLKNQFL